MDAYLTPAEVAEQLRLAPKTLRNLRHKGGGPPFVKVGQSVRYPRREFEQWRADRPLFARTHDRAAS